MTGEGNTNRVNQTCKYVYVFNAGIVGLEADSSNHVTCSLAERHALPWRTVFSSAGASSSFLPFFWRLAVISSSSFCSSCQPTRSQDKQHQRSENISQCDRKPGPTNGSSKCNLITLTEYVFCCCFMHQSIFK